MGFRHVGWSMIVGGIAMAAVGLVFASGTALVVSLMGVGFVVTGVLYLWFGAMEGGGLYSGDRWRTRGRRVP